MAEIKINSLKTYDEAKSVAQLHFNYITLSFLAKLGKEFLVDFYDATRYSTHGFSLIAKKDEKVVGFIAGSSDLAKLYKEFLRKKGAKIVFLLLKKSLNPKLLWGIAELLFYPKRIYRRKVLPKAELIAVAIDPPYRNKKYGSLLIKSFFEKIKTYNVDKVKVIVGAGNKRAIDYYRKHGFIHVNSFFLHKGIKSFIFVKELQKSQ